MDMTEGTVKNRVADGLFGLCVGDALGLPVEFISRYSLKENPVTDMAGYGRHNQPPGTWSDDSSLTFCLAESLCNGFNLHDIASKSCKWLDEGYWTPYGIAFDIGNTTRSAILRLRQCANPTEAGGKGEHSNGNGSLMRILPMAYQLENTEEGKRFEMVHQVSSLTHGHPRCQMACGIYIQLAINLLKGSEPDIAYKNMKTTTLNYYEGKELYNGEIDHFSRVLRTDISTFSEDEIKSSGYVIDTLEAGLWSFLNSNSYSKAVLTAVNLGRDTDTTGAVSGGLAGIYYGFENIPKHWIKQIAGKEEIMELANKLNEQIYGEK